MLSDAVDFGISSLDLASLDPRASAFTPVRRVLKLKMVWKQLKRKKGTNIRERQACSHYM